MIIGAALVLLSAGGLPQELYLQEESPGTDTFVRLRGGAWASNGFEFRAIRTDSVLVHSDGQALASGGIDLGIEIGGQFVLWGTVEVSASDDVLATAAGGYVGYRARSKEPFGHGVPDEVTLYAGGLWGTFEVKQSGFGDFDDAIGLGAGIELTWLPARGLVLSAIGEYRLMEFDYERDVLPGEQKHAGGSGIWAGLAIEFRF